LTSWKGNMLLSNTYIYTGLQISTQRLVERLFIR